jgi:hypothetical protein
VRRNRRNPNSSSKDNLLPKVLPISHPIFRAPFLKGLLAPQAGLEAHQEDPVLAFRIVLGLRVAFLVVLVLSLDRNTECLLMEPRQAGILARGSISLRALSPLICPSVHQDNLL